MFKQVDITPSIRAKLQAASGGHADSDVSKLAVFEAQAVNTKPLVRRKGGLFQNARTGMDTLQAMAHQVNSGDNVPIKLMHEPGIPVGRVFDAGVRSAGEGQSALHTLFYMDPGATELVSKLNNGVIKDVSVGFQAKNLLCSECGFDYGAPETNWMNICDATCNNDHKIGVGGVHLRMHGLDSFHELSLVDRGASTGSEILGRGSQSLARTDQMNAFLAARGFDPRLLECRFSAADTDIPTITAPKGTSAMTPEQALELSLKAALAERDVLSAATEKTALLAAHSAALTDLQTKLAAAEASVAALSVGELATVKAEVVSLRADLALATADIDARITAAFALTGKAGTAVPSTMADKVKVLGELQVSLATAIPGGGVGRPAGTGTGDQATAADSNKFAAFKRS